MASFECIVGKNKIRRFIHFKNHVLGESLVKKESSGEFIQEDDSFEDQFIELFPNIPVERVIQTNYDSFESVSNLMDWLTKYED